MGILDEAIREHLELKRQHGADDSELDALEKDAFGPAERPGAEGPASEEPAEAPTEFMAQPETAQAVPPDQGGEEPSPREEAASRIADLQEAPQPDRADEVGEGDEQADQDAPVASSGPSTEERHAIAEQPTQHFDIEEELAATAEPAPSDEALVEEELTEPRIGPIEVGDDEPVAAEEEDDFFDEQRLSEELDQALEGPAEVAAEAEQAEEPAPEEPVQEEQLPGTEEHAATPHADEDVLEETPDFLEESPEDDELWFEQKPPKDFDFDD